MPVKGYVYDNRAVVLPQGLVAFGRVYYDYLKREGLKDGRSYPALAEYEAQQAFQRQLCDGELLVTLLTDREVEREQSVEATLWGDNHFLERALKQGWQDLGDGSRGIYVVREHQLDRWLRAPAIRAEVASATQQLSPFIEVMIIVAQRLDVGPANHPDKEKEVAPALEAVWKECFPSRDAISKEQLKYMATCVRWPEAKQGRANQDIAKRNKKSTAGKGARNPSQATATKKKIE